MQDAVQHFNYNYNGTPNEQINTASGSRLDLGRAPCVAYGVKYIDLVSLAPF